MYSKMEHTFSHLVYSTLKNVQSIVTLVFGSIVIAVLTVIVLLQLVKMVLARAIFSMVSIY